MLYYKIINSSKGRLVKQIIQEHRAQNHQKHLLWESGTIAEEWNMKLEAALTMKKSGWTRRIKDKVRNKIQKNVEKEIENKTKPRTVRKNNWERKKYVATCNSDLKKDYKN